MEEERVVAPVVKRRGCIKTTRGAWLVRRQRRGGAVATSWRKPSESERENNRQRERRRREVAARIYDGLKKYGNYQLPKYANQNDVLEALCREAGWNVEEDGTVHRMHVQKENTVHDKSFTGGPNADITTFEEDELSLNLSLSFESM